MPRCTESDRDYLHLLARLLWQPGLQRRLDFSDAVQQTLLKAHLKLDQCKGKSKEEWRGWLRKILLNELRQAARGISPGEVSLNESSRNLEELIAADHSSPSGRALRQEQLERLADALGKLLEAERTAVELKYLHGCSVDFISQHMGRTGPAVGGLLKRGLANLRQLLKEHAEEEKG
jgi:RNA polymerase sigma-70 factor (ECF subfamily)